MCFNSKNPSHNSKIAKSFGFSFFVSMHAVYNDVSMTALPQECLVGGLVVVTVVKRTETEDCFLKAWRTVALLCNGEDP